VPLTCVFMAGSEWIIRIAFQRGAFKPEDTALVSFIQQMYLLQVPFLVIGLLGVRLLVAMSRNHLLTFMSVVNLVVNVVGNLIFMRWFGAAGIALSTSVVYVVSMTMILVLVNRSLSTLERERVRVNVSAA
jgi:putative peptidoglycan lipid II flippase